MKQRVYDRDGTYVSEEGSDFFKDPEQLKAVAIFCAVLGVVFKFREHRRGVLVTDSIREAVAVVHRRNSVWVTVSWY